MAKKMKTLEIKKYLLVEIVRKGMPVVGNLSSTYLPCGKTNGCPRSGYRQPAVVLAENKYPADRVRVSL